MVPVTPEALIATADRCVKCGLCLPHCPTYQLYRDEAESPRGRISLVQGLLSGALEADPALLGHLNRCLLCRNCETACPSQVEYARLMDGARGLISGDTRPPLELSALTNSALLPGLLPMGAVAEKIGLAGILPKKYAFMTRLAANMQASSAYDLPQLGCNKGRVALFEGCVTSVTDRSVLTAAEQVLHALGYEVVKPDGRLCCGAMHQHAGFSKQADERLGKTSASLSALGAQAIVTVASGCGAQLMDYAELPVPLRDLGAFVSRAQWDDDVLRRLEGRRVALHHPCSLRNGMNQASGVADLLSRFHGLEVILLPPSGCCGAAGMHLIEYPEMARQLAAPLVDQIRESGVHVLLTSNTGCSLHLDNELRAAGLTVAVRHPVEWLYSELGSQPPTKTGTRA